jgi:hypothetical protein
LLVDHDEPVVGEYEHIAEDFEPAADSLAWDEHWLEFRLYLRDVDFGRIAEDV